MNVDPRVMEHFPMTYTAAQSAEQVGRFREHLQINGYGWWALEIKGGARFAGSIALQDVPFESHFTPALEVGWRLAHEHWHQGYATEGARVALRFAFDSLDRREVVAMTARTNLRSQAVMARLQMTRDPADDFENPRVADGHPLKTHVLYRIGRAAFDRSGHRDSIQPKRAS